LVAIWAPLIPSASSPRISRSRRVRGTRDGAAATASEAAPLVS
jgi:hypothetical protein